jgi:hypothetical protein
MGGDDVKVTSFFSGQGQGWGRSVTLDAVFSVTVVANGDGSVPRRVRVTEQGSYRRGWAAGKTRRPAWRAAPALCFLTGHLAFSRKVPIPNHLRDFAPDLEKYKAVHFPV